MKSDKTVTELFDLINKERVKDLVQDPKLTKLAQGHADFMSSADWLVHSNQRYPEVILYQSRLNAEWALDIWMNSPPHKGILLGAYTKIGLAYSQNKRRTFWCAMLSSALPRPRYPRL